METLDLLNALHCSLGEGFPSEIPLGYFE